MTKTISLSLSIRPSNTFRVIRGLGEHKSLLGGNVPRHVEELSGQLGAVRGVVVT